MANNITITNNTDVSPQRWDVAYTVDQAGTKEATLNTAGTVLDRNIRVKVITSTGAYTVAGGGLTAGTGTASLSASSGYYNGSSYNASDKITLGTTQSAGYYKLVASGSGQVTRAAITKQVTTSGFLAQDSAAVTFSAVTTGTSNTGTADYFIKKSTLSTASVTPAIATTTVTISSGYYPTDRSVTVNAMNTMTLPTATAASSVGTAVLTATPGTASSYLNIPVGYNTASSYYTIKGDANLIADNIKSGVSIFGVNGTYMGSQITITDTPDSGGGTIRTINYTTDTNTLYGWLGVGATLLGTQEWDVNVSDTTFDSWTASTTAKSILAAATSNNFSYTYNRDTESLAFITNVTTQYAYIEGATLKNTPIVTNRTDITFAFGFPSTLAQYQNKTIGTQSYITAGGANRAYYYNASGATTLWTSTAYGIYSYAAPTLSSTLSGNTVTAGYRRAAIYARCYSTVFATARKAEVDSANSKVHYKVQVYKIPRVNNLWVVGWDSICDSLNSV